MKNLIKILDNVQLRIESLYRIICIIFAFGLFILLIGNVFVRIFPVVSLHWFDEIVELLFAWLVFLGSAVLFSRRDHFKIDWLSKLTKDTKMDIIYRILINLICLTFFLIFMFQSFRLTRLANDWTSVFNIPKKVYYSSMPLAGLFMVYVSLLDLLKIFYYSIISESPLDEVV